MRNKVSSRHTSLSLFPALVLSNIHSRHHGQPRVLLRHDHRRRARRPHRDDSPRRRHPQDRRCVSRIVIGPDAIAPKDLARSLLFPPNAEPSRGPRLASRSIGDRADVVSIETRLARATAAHQAPLHRPPLSPLAAASRRSDILTRRRLGRRDRFFAAADRTSRSRRERVPAFDSRRVAGATSLHSRSAAVGEASGRPRRRLARRCPRPRPRRTRP